MARPRLRDLGFSIGTLPTGRWNAITDVPGVRVGHVTLVADEPRVARTGVTAIYPLECDYWDEVVFAGFHSFNGFGEVTGSHWIREVGILSSPIVLSSAFSIGMLRDTLLADTFDNGHTHRFHQPVAGETYDGMLNDGLARHVQREHVKEAMRRAVSGPVEEGNVGGGTGMVCHEFKGGIGTSSRIVDCPNGRYTVGVLVQTNYGLRQYLTVDGVPVGREIPYSEIPSVYRREDGSIIIVVATDAPLLPPQCERLARRATLGLGRTGGYGNNTSGDLIVAFSTGNRLPAIDDEIVSGLRMLPNVSLTPFFPAVAEATEEAIVNALLTAESMTGREGNAAQALPHERFIEIMGRHGRKPAV